MEKKVTAWVAASQSSMSRMQEVLFYNGSMRPLFPAAMIQEDRSRHLDDLDAEAFLQAYIEGVAYSIGTLSELQEDPSCFTPGDFTRWPALWMSKIQGRVEMDKEDKDFHVDLLLHENDQYGVHLLGITPQEFADQTLQQILVPVSLADIQAGLAYLTISADLSDKYPYLQQEILMSKEAAHSILDAYRTSRANLLHTLTKTKRKSVISPNAIR